MKRFTRLLIASLAVLALGALYWLNIMPLMAYLVLLLTLFFGVSLFFLGRSMLSKKRLRKSK